MSKLNNNNNFLGRAHMKYKNILIKKNFLNVNNLKVPRFNQKISKFESKI